MKMPKSSCRLSAACLLLLVCGIGFIAWYYWVRDTPERKVYRLLREFHKLPDDTVDLSYPGRSRKAIEADWDKLGPEAVPALIKALRDRSCPNRYLAAGKLGTIADSQAVQPLLECLEDTDHIVRLWVVNALGEIGDARAVKPIILRLHDTETSVRKSAAAALGRLGNHRALLALTKALEDEDLGTRVEAIRSLASLGDKTAADPIRALMRKDPADLVQEEGRRALRKLDVD
jgi:HEAT repeat protein